MFPEKIRDHAGILLRQFAGALRKDQKSVGTAFQALHDEIPGAKSLNRNGPTPVLRISTQKEYRGQRINLCKDDATSAASTRIPGNKRASATFSRQQGDTPWPSEASRKDHRPSKP
jgi:hypothetical protein